MLVVVEVFLAVILHCVGFNCICQSAGVSFSMFPFVCDTVIAVVVIVPVPVSVAVFVDDCVLCVACFV